MVNVIQKEGKVVVRTPIIDWIILENSKKEGEADSINKVDLFSSILV